MNVRKFIAVTARDALRMSLNIPAVMALDRVGPLAFTLTLQNAGARLAFPAGGEAPIFGARQRLADGFVCMDGLIVHHGREAFAAASTASTVP